MGKSFEFIIIASVFVLIAAVITVLLFPKMAGPVAAFIIASPIPPIP